MKSSTTLALTAAAVAASFGLSADLHAFNAPLRTMPAPALAAFNAANQGRGIPAASSGDAETLRRHYGFGARQAADAFGLPSKMQKETAARFMKGRNLFEPQARADDGSGEISPADLESMSREDLDEGIERYAQLVRIIGADAREDGRDLTAREERRLNAAEESLALLRAEAAGRTSRGRRTNADAHGPDTVSHASRAQLDAGRARASLPASPRDPRASATGGFKHQGEFFAAVINGSAMGATPDPRLIANAAPTTYGSEGVGSDGGFAVPPDFRSEIVKRVMGEDSLLALTDQMTTGSNSITVPTDETTPWQTSGGIQAYWEAEAGLKTQSKPQLTEKTVKASKVICLIPMTDELLQDAPSMAAYLSSKAPEKIDFRVNDAILNGSGVGMPLGFLKSGALITVPAQGGQAADTVVFQNVVDMYTRSTAQTQKKGVWLVNSDVQSQLMTMQFPGTGTAVPAYLPAGGLSAQPYGTLLGRPVIPTEAAAALGDVGDISFVDLKQYMSVVKAGGVKQDVSIHIWFDYDMTAFRFVLRVGGQPWWNTPVTRLNGATRSPFIALAAR